MKLFEQIEKVAGREIRIWKDRPLYLWGSVGVMLLSALFFLTFFGSGLPEKLPIGVVDLDGSSTSRNFSAQLDATQLGRVIPFGDVTEARKQLDRGDICAFVVIPEHFDREVQSFHCPKMGVYANTLYPVIGGALAYKDVMFMVNLTNGAVQRQVLRAKGKTDREIMGIIQPLVLDAHNIGNGPTSYAYYLCNMILAGILAMAIMLVVSYSLGSELKFGTSKHLLEFSDGSIVTAVLGKLLPYTVLFTLLGTCLQLLMFGILGYPLQGSIWWMIVAMLCMVMSYEALAVFIVSMVPTLRLGVCISALYSVLGFSFAGFTLPVESLPAWLQGLSDIYPLRFYYQIFVREALYGTGFAGWWPSLVALLLFQALPYFSFGRLKDAYQYQKYPRN
ncbi:MAG: ABC transporter permease [Bacteroidales bacterium]|nr:ABC transporter permease [Bacteroidales bacterium]